jgi:L-asparaginase II
LTSITFPKSNSNLSGEIICMQSNDCVPLLTLTRGNVIESCHYGAFAVVDCNGTLIAFAGNPGLITFPRSSMKPFQALAFLEKKGDEFYDLSFKEIAIMCASHSGTDAHVEVLKEMHNKIGISVNDLKCGVHWPMDKATADAMRLRHELPDAYRHNCSGKHTGMLAHARMRGLPLENYLNLNHPIQRTILQVVSEMCDLDPASIEPGIDGCSAPVFALPLCNFAMAIACICDPTGLFPDRENACNRIIDAMVSFPEMVAGPGRFDTLLMEALSGKVIAKGGAEGYQVIGIRPGAFGPGSPALGIALKVADGDYAKRAISSISLSIFEQLGLLSPDTLNTLSEFAMRKVTNWRDIEVGMMQPAFSISKFSWQA